jgi:hypothetical protein
MGTISSLEATSARAGHEEQGRHAVGAQRLDGLVAAAAPLFARGGQAVGFVTHVEQRFDRRP